MSKSLTRSFSVGIRQLLEVDALTVKDVLRGLLLPIFHSPFKGLDDNLHARISVANIGAWVVESELG